MKLKLNISTKLWLGFGVLLSAILINGILTYSTVVNSAKLNAELHDVIRPSILNLKDLKSLLNQSDKLISVWVRDSEEDLPQKSELSTLHNDTYPVISKSLKKISPLWSEKEQKIIDSLFIGIDTVLRAQHNIMIRYDERESYQSEKGKVELALLERSYGNGDRYEQIVFLSYIVEGLIKRKEEQSKRLRYNMERAFKRLQNYIIGLGIILLVGGVFIAYFLTRSIVNPINQLKELLITMGKGILPNVIAVKRKDEIGEINKALANLISGLKSIVKFSKSVGEGDFNVDFKPLSDQDDLGNNLLLMSNNLKAVSEEDFKRNWTTGGLAKFSELLRISSDNVSKLSENLIMELVRYLKANQGGIFVINNGDPNLPFLEMKGCYAWDRQKFIDQKIFSGDGLIGQSWLERETLYITDIPKDYVTITSGLGKALPRSILLIPMISNDEVFGVMEIASFNLLEDYEIAFVKSLADSTATTISSARVNERTKQLLSQTQNSSEKMKLQEEEMIINQDIMNNNQEALKAEIESLKTKMTEYTHKNNHLKDENEILQNLLLKYKKQLDS